MKVFIKLNGFDAELMKVFIFKCFFSMQGIVWTAGGNNKLLYCGAQDQSVLLVFV